VEGPPQPPFRGWEGFNRQSGQGLPHLQKAHFTGTYPIAKVDFEDRALPVTISLESFNPFIPLNVDDSSLPVAIFKYTVKNHSQKPVDFSLAFSLLNAVGYDGQAYLDGISLNHPGFGGNITNFRQEGELAGLDLTSNKYSPDKPQAGSLALIT